MTPNTNDLSTWLTKQATADALNISERTLDRLVAAGKGPERREVPRKGIPPEPRFNPDDVAALAAARNPPMVMAPESPLAIRAAQDGIPQHFAVVLAIVEQLAAIAQRPRLETAQPNDRLWLTIAEASAYSGLSERFLRRAVKDGALYAVRDRAVKVRKADLDTFALSDVSDAKAESAGAR